MLFTYKSYIISYEVRMIFQIKKTKAQRIYTLPKITTTKKR